jgi:tetratricopeptide (TPR) repeat protein
LNYNNADINEKRLRDIRAKIEVLYDIERLELLIEEAHKLLSIEPNDEYALFMMGLAYIKLENLDEAKTAALRYLELRPNEPNAHSLYGKISSYKGDYKLSVAEFQKAIELNPEDNYYYVNLAINLYMLDNANLNKTLELALKAVELNPNDYLGHAYLSDQYLKAGRLIDAHRESCIALELNPDVPIVHEQYGAVQSYLGNFDSAEEHLLESLRLSPSNTAAQEALKINMLYKEDKGIYYLNTAEYYWELGDICEAEALGLRYIEEFPCDGRAYYLFAYIVHNYKNDTLSAIEQLNKSIELDKTNAKAYHLLSNCIYIQDEKNIKQSIELSLKASEIDPKDPIIRAFLGALYLANCDFDNAEQELFIALELGPELSLVNAMYAKLQVYSADFEKAQKYIDEALKLNPQDGLASEILKDLNNYRSNPTHYLKIMLSEHTNYISKYPKSAKGHLVLSKLYTLKGASVKAAVELERHLNLRPDNVQALEIYIKLMTDLKKEKQLLTYLDRLHAHYPNNDIIMNHMENIRKTIDSDKSKKMWNIILNALSGILLVSLLIGALSFISS